MAEKLVGIIGGTGLGEALAGHINSAESVTVETPFGRPSGDILIGRIGGNKIAFLNRHGDGHRFGPSDVPYAANLFALKKVGVRSIISSGAVGSMQEEIAPGDLVVVEQFIDKTFKRQNTFFEGFGAVHCEMSHPTCARLSKLVLKTAEKTNIKTHGKGTYVCMEGPQFSTRAESLMHKSWGGDLIGMTAMPEAKLAREAQICYCLVALVSDFDCWKERGPGKNKQTLLAEIIENLKTATNNCLELIKSVLAESNGLICNSCGCRSSLDLAVWTKDEKIDSTKKEELQVLFK